MTYELKDLRYEVTLWCNMRCPHCFADAGHTGRRIHQNRMNIAQATSVIEQAIDLGLEKLSFTGGEPTLKMDYIQKISRVAKEHGVYVRVFTNGTLLTPGMIQTLEEVGVREVQISIDGLQGKHDDFRGVRGSFYNGINRLNELSNYSFTRAVRVTVTSKNYHQIPRLFKEYLLPLELDKYRVRPFTPAGRGRIHRGYMLTPEQHRKVFTYLADLKRDGVNISFLANCFSHLYGWADSHCTCGITQAYLTHDGLLKPCGYIRTVLGRCTTMPLRDIWFSEHPMLVALRSPPKSTGKCLKCKHWKDCLGGCKASSYETHKDVNAPDPVCPIEVHP